MTDRIAASYQVRVTIRESAEGEPITPPTNDRLAQLVRQTVEAHLGRQAASVTVSSERLDR